MTTTRSEGHQMARALTDCLTTYEYLDSNAEPANMVDAIFAQSRSLDRHADSLDHLADALVLSAKLLSAALKDRQ